jgi:hypothetical protein
MGREFIIELVIAGFFAFGWLFFVVEQQRVEIVVAVKQLWQQWVRVAFGVGRFWQQSVTQRLIVFIEQQQFKQQQQ